jgi:transcriptional regulator with XRE-family HTH domain
MQVHEKIRFIRQQNGWSQEEMASKLGMSLNGYGSIERGDTNVSLSRLNDIAAGFCVNVRELFGDISCRSDRNVFNSMGANNVETQNNQCYFNCHFTDGTSGCSYLEMKCEFEKLTFINEQQKKEVMLLKEINELLKKASSIN